MESSDSEESVSKNARLIASGDHPTQQNNPFAVDMNNLPAARQLSQFSQNMQNTANKASTKTAFRNLPKLCSFWLNGTCNRVLKKTCPFRPCCGPTAYAFPEIAGSDRELCAELIKQLKDVGPAVLMKTLSPEIKKAISVAIRGVNRDDAIRKRVSGEDELTNRYMSKMKNMHMELLPPDDPNNITLWLGNIDADITETDIRDTIYSYGVIMNIHISRPGKCAFVEFLDRSMAENAAKFLYNNLEIKGRSINVNWSKPKSIASSSSSSSSSNNGENDPNEFTMMAPPGLENAPLTAYSIVNPPPPPAGKPPTTDTSSADNITTLGEDEININGKRSSSITEHQSISKVNKIVYPSLKADRLGSNPN